MLDKLDQNGKLFNETVEKHEKIIKNLSETIARLEEKDPDGKIVEKLCYEDISKPPPTKWEQIKNAGNNISGTASVHGLARIVKTDKLIVKLLWSIMIVISSGFGVFTVGKSSLEYLEYHYITQSETVYVDRLMFPAVTFCEKKKYAKARNYQYNFTYIEFSEKNYTFEEIFDEHFYIKEQDHDVYYCIRFNGYNEHNPTRPFWYSRGTDYVNGLHLEFQMPADDHYIKFYIKDNYRNSYNESVSMIASGWHEYHIHMKEKITHKLGEPYDRCVKQSNETYRKQNMVDICEEELVAERYGCSFPGYHENFDIPECDNFDVPYDIIKECKSRYEKECYSKKYDLTVLPDDSHSNKNVSYVPVQFSIYFGELSSTDSVEYPQSTLSDLISKVGGELAIFIGIRFLSLIEICEFFIECFYILVRPRIYH